MTAIFLSPLYIAVNVYVAVRAIRWMTALWGRLGHPLVKGIFVTVFTLFAATPLMAVLADTGEIHRILRYISNCWLGVLGITLAVLLIFDGARLILNRTVWKGDTPSVKRLKRGGICAVLIIILLSLYGVYHGDRVYVREERVVVPAQISGELRIALIADLHLGYNTKQSHIDEVVRAVNESNVDMVAVAGDVFDNQYAAIKDPDRLAASLSKMKSRYGTYVCWGNHDVEEKILAGFTFGGSEPKSDEQFRRFLKKADMTLLEDQKIVIGESFCLAGRKDGSKAEKEGEERMSPKELLMDAPGDIPVIVMDHQPSDNERLAEAGADIILSGHTHDGQIFPANLIMGMIYDNPYGVERYKESVSCVTSGAGLWGPPMRIGTDSEVMIIDVEFKEM